MEELTSKQRAQLRGLANSIDTILHVGKDGIGDNLVKQADDALEARELIKGKVLENRSEEHTSELQSRLHLVCRLLLEKKNKKRKKKKSDKTSSTD